MFQITEESVSHRNGRDSDEALNKKGQFAGTEKDNKTGRNLKKWGP